MGKRTKSELNNFSEGLNSSESSMANSGALDKIAKLLAILITKGLTQREQIVTLRHAGFSRSEIADMIETTPHQVSVVLHQQKQEKTSKKQPKG
jgi:hypothetical protein